MPSHQQQRHAVQLCLMALAQQSLSFTISDGVGWFWFLRCEAFRRMRTECKNATHSLDHTNHISNDLPANKLYFIKSQYHKKAEENRIHFMARLTIPECRAKQKQRRGRMRKEACCCVMEGRWMRDRSGIDLLASLLRDYYS